jgi:hypothetical protein
MSGLERSRIVRSPFAADMQRRRQYDRLGLLLGRYSLDLWHAEDPVRLTSEMFDQIHMSDHQRINHFRNHYEVPPRIQSADVVVDEKRFIGQEYETYATVFGQSVRQRGTG